MTDTLHDEYGDTGIIQRPTETQRPSRPEVVPVPSFHSKRGPMKKLKGFRTLGTNIAFLAAGVLAIPEVAEVVPSSVLPWVIVGQSVANIILRAKTDTPVGRIRKRK